MADKDELALALKLKAAADKAVDNFDPNMFILTRDMAALLAERDADKKNIAELKRDVDSANARVDTKCAQLCKQDEEIEMLRLRIAELEAREETLRPVGVMSEKAFYRLERSESRFIALWPRPGIHLPRKRPDDGLIVYARTAAGIKVKMEEV